MTPTAWAAGEHPCTYGKCGQPDTHPYPEGPRCDPHSPWARAAAEPGLCPVLPAEHLLLQNPRMRSG